MGMIFPYIHIPHILHILSTQSSQTNHIRRFPCSLPFLYSLPTHISLVVFFSRRPALRSCFRFRPRRPVFRRGPRCGGLRFAFTGLPPCRLVGRAVARVAPFRSSLCHVGLWGSAPFLSACFPWSFLSFRGVRFPGRRRVLSSCRSSRCGVAIWRFVCSCRSVHRLVRRSVRRSGFVASRRASRCHPSRMASRFIVVFASSVIARRSSLVGHRSPGVSLRFVVGIGMGSR